MDQKAERSPLARAEGPRSRADGERPRLDQDGRDGELSRNEGFRLEAPIVSLPKGGGAIKSIDEKFSVNPSNGTMSLSLPLPFSPGRNGVTPAVSISYDSGTGNGVAGLGWSLDLHSIRRRTDRQLPRYHDDEDIFLSGGEDLVPASVWDVDHWRNDTVETGLYTVRRYRPRSEGSFSRIERISHPLHGTWWRITTRDDFTTLYGLDETSRIADPSDTARIYQWLPALAFDNLGNCVVYQYKAENLDGVQPSLAERNRISKLAPFANCYLKRVAYGNRIPYFPDEADPYRPALPTGNFIYEAIFDYGEHDVARPTPAQTPGMIWGVRTDPFSTYRSGFDIRTYRLLRRILMFHSFDELAGGQPCLVRSLDLDYQASSGTLPTQVTRLVSATQCGYHLLPGGDYSRKTLPPFELDYETLQWDNTIREVEPDSVANLPAGAETGAGSQWMDLFGEGIPGVFTEQAGAWFYKANLGDVDEDGRVRFGPQRLVAPKPSFAGVETGTLRLEDLEYDGSKQIVVDSPELHGYFELAEHDQWLPFRSFTQVLRIDLDDRNVRRLDLDGDGRTDILISEEEVFVCYASDGKRGHKPMGRAAKPRDEERGAAIVFADATQSIYLADMNGDGLADIVRIRNRDVGYWPNLGYGRFGARVAMNNAPAFDHPDTFNPAYLQLADVSGTGLTDLLYLGAGDCKAYLNLSGNGWSDAQPIAPFFSPEKPNVVSTADLLGNGTTCIVWSSPLPAHAEAPLRYIDLMGGRKPHLLTKYVNNLGKEVTLSYKSSTWYYLKDKLEGRPWITKLAFPVHCVRRMEVRDRIAGSRFASEYRYHHGYFDREEREFRGFGMIEQVDTEQFEHWVKQSATNIVEQPLHQPPVLTRTWFHTGAFLDRQRILTQFRDEYWDREMARQGFAAEASAAIEPPLPDARIIAASGIDPDALDKLTADELRQAFRACKGMALRTEVFALDSPAIGATPAERLRQLSPYTVATHNCLVELLQPSLNGSPAIYVTRESEAITWNYDRELADPRVEHKLNVRINPYGDILESASVAYGRKIADLTLPADARASQARTWITYRRTDMTNDTVSQAHHRLRRASQISEWEIRGLAKAGSLYRVSDFVNDVFDVLTASVETPYHQKTIDPPPGTVFRRLMHRKQSLYYNDDAQSMLPLHSIGFRALPFENYQLAFTTELLADIFAGRATDPMLVEGKYVHRDDTAWWIRSGRNEYLTGVEAAAAARSRFFMPIAHIDGHGARTILRPFANYFLMVQETEDAANNVNRVTDFDLRLPLPRRMQDANDNVTEVLFDELGLVNASARLGKGMEGDNFTGLTAWSTPAGDAEAAAFFVAASSTELTTRAEMLVQNAGMRHLYDVHRYRASGGTLPPVVATISREQHFAVSAASPVQISFEYSNGMGGVAMAKAQAEPGLAKQVTVQPGNVVVIQEIDTAALDPRQLRWLGTGRKVLNNKGKTVKEYEPYFSVTHKFESYPELVESGVTPVKLFDAIGRLVRIDEPDGTFVRRVHTSWSLAVWDRNDTAKDSAWYDRRFNRLIDVELIAAGKNPVREAEAAAASAEHDGTPRTTHIDPFGETVVEVEHNGLDALNQPILFVTRSLRDIQGHVLNVIDPRGNQTISYKYDMIGRTAYRNGMDDGQRWMLDDIIDEPLRSWDERNHEFAFAYDDPLHRLTSKRVTGGDGPAPLNHVFERHLYGEGVAGDKTLNLRGRVAVLYDTAGKTENQRFDFKGNIVESARRFVTAYRETPNWPGMNPDALLDAESFGSAAMYDALNRVAERTTPDGSIYRPEYNEANLLNTVRVEQDGVDLEYVRNIDYDEKGRRQRIVFGNDVSVTYTYDQETRRLLRLVSRKSDGQLLQDYLYTYDAMGNLTHLEDRCVPTVWFENAMITGLATYRYDPVYRLIEATGREHSGQLASPVDNWDDLPFRKSYSVNDPMAWRNYTETYEYDFAGNVSQVTHAALPTGSWTRDHTYAAASNRLQSTQQGVVFPYSHHPAHGYMTSMPHLSLMTWNFRDELQAVATQVVNDGVPETTWYIYDGEGKRVRKVTARAAASVDAATKKSERYYLDGVEIYREYGAGAATTTERRTFHVMDDRQRVAMIDRHTIASGGAADPRLVRYQGPDHIGSARLETDENARVISYEEFHPFGTTSYQAVDKDVVAAAKRYRYAEMERDEESGLAHHGARYYVPWLARWSAPDKLAQQITGNRYAYANNNPIVRSDTNGMFEEPLHGATTFRLLVAAGFEVNDAARIALADAAMDQDYPDQADVPQTVFTPDRARHGHFDPEHAVARIEGDIAGFRRRTASSPSDPAALETFGRNLHNLEDVGFPDEPGPHQRGAKMMSADLIAGGVALGLIGGTMLGVMGAERPKSRAVHATLFVVANILLFAAGVLLIIGLTTRGLGHGTYTSEMGETSGWMPPSKFVSDQAFQDPVKNTRLLNREFQTMVRAAQAYYGRRRDVDHAAAARAIYEVTHADTSARISAVLNATVDGNTSYMSILSTRASVTRPGSRAWSTSEVDVGPFSEQTRERVRRRGEVADEKFNYDPEQKQWDWGYRGR